MVQSACCFCGGQKLFSLCKTSEEINTLFWPHRHLHERTKTHTHTNLRKSPGRSTSPTFLTSSTSSTSSTSRMWSIERDCHSIRLGTLGGARLGRKQEATPALQSPGSQSLMAGLLIRVPARNECVKTAGKSQLIREPVKCSY